jgi:hypothetical protein
MSRKITLSIFCFVVINIFYCKAYAQVSADSSNTSLTAYNNTINKFYIAIGSKSRLYNGKAYNGDYAGVTGNANFNDAADWTSGNISYDGYLYKNVKIKYDLFKDLVVIPLYNSYLKISLINEKLTGFDIFGHHFICIKNNPAAINPVATGIYDQLYGGKVQVLCKRDKSLQQDHSGTTITSYFSYADNYYVFKNNQYFPANSRGEFLDAFKDKKKELQQFIRANGLKFRKNDKEQVMAKVAEYYDHISG